MNVADVNGWYLAEPAYRKWNEDFMDEDTGEVVSIERNEVIAPMGEQLTPISISMLQANGIVDILVSDEKITGIQQKHMSLWQLEAVSYNPITGKEQSDYFFVPKGSPLECEIFFKEWAEQNIKGRFTIKKVVPLDFGQVLFPYDEEAEEAQKKKHIPMYFYKVVMKPLDGCARKILAFADSIHTVEQAVKIDADYLTDIDSNLWRIAEIKEINVRKVFEEGIKITRYSLGMYNPRVTTQILNLVDKMAEAGASIEIPEQTE